MLFLLSRIQNLISVFTQCDCATFTSQIQSQQCGVSQGFPCVSSMEASVHNYYLYSSPCRNKWLNPYNSCCGCHFNSMLLSQQSDHLFMADSWKTFKKNLYHNLSRITSRWAVFLGGQFKTLKTINTDNSLICTCIMLVWTAIID